MLKKLKSENINKHESFNNGNGMIKKAVLLKPGITKKDLLVDSAVKLFYSKGISSTSIADIATEAGVPVGNVYYYFKTKEEIGLAAAESRIDEVNERLAEIESLNISSIGKVLAFLDAYKARQDEMVENGCPVAMICQQGDTKNDPVARKYASIYIILHKWLEDKIAEYGASNAGEKALSIMVRLQGATIISKALSSPNILSEEMARIKSDLSTF